jgi:hypothetical protein
VREIRIYVEGGSKGINTRAPLREGFDRFLTAPKAKAQAGRIRWQVIICGSRSETYRLFHAALTDHADAFNILLVDAERPIITSVREHLSVPTEDNWNLSGCDEEQLHLMVQVMESWFIADAEALHRYYGQRFSEKALPRSRNVESILKADVEQRLKTATRQTQAGEYHKTRHAPELLKRIDPAKVRAASTHCERLFTVLEEKVG